MARDNTGKYKDFADGTPTDDSDFDVSLQKNPGDYRDAVSSDLLGDGVLNDEDGWLVLDLPGTLSVAITQGSGLISGQRVTSEGDVSLIGLTASSTLKVYAMAHTSNVYVITDKGWPTTFGFTDGSLPSDSIQIAEVITGATSNTTITDKRSIINSKTGAYAVDTSVVTAGQAKGFSDRVSMIANQIAAISGSFAGDLDADDPTVVKAWYELLSDETKGGPRLHDRDRSLYGLNKQFDTTLSGDTATPTAGPTLTPATSGGFLIDDVYYVLQTWVDLRGDETAASAETASTVSGGGTNGKITVTANVSLPTNAASMNVYASRTTGGPYFFQATVTGTNSLILTTLLSTGLTAPTVNSTQDVYSHDHTENNNKVSGPTVGANNVTYTPSGDITATLVQAAILSLSNKKVSLTGDTITPATGDTIKLTALAPADDDDVVIKSTLDTAAAALGPSRFVSKDIVAGKDIAEVDFGPEVSVFTGTIDSKGGLIMLTADSGITTEGALTHSNQFEAQYGPGDIAAGQPLFPGNSSYFIQPWKKIVLLVWRFYRNGINFRTSVQSWSSIPNDPDNAANFNFDGTVRVSTIPAYPTWTVPKRSKNFVHTLGPIQTTTWGSAFRYCVWTPPPKIIDPDVLEKPGSYTYEVRVAGITGSTSWRSIRMQGYSGWTDFEGWEVTDGGGLNINVAPGSGLATNTPYATQTYISSLSSQAATTALPASKTGLKIYATRRTGFSLPVNDNAQFEHDDQSLSNTKIEIATVNTDASSITLITSSKTGVTLNPGKLNIVEFR